MTSLKLAESISHILSHRSTNVDDVLDEVDTLDDEENSAVFTVLSEGEMFSIIVKKVARPGVTG